MNENVAQAMHQMAENANNEREQASKIAAEQWVDSVVLETIKRTAQRGEYHLDIMVPRNVHKTYAENYLITGGFTLDQFGTEYSRYIRIKW